MEYFSKMLMFYIFSEFFKIIMLINVAWNLVLYNVRYVSNWVIYCICPKHNWLYLLKLYFLPEKYCEKIQ